MASRCEQVFTSAHAELLRAAYVTLAGQKNREARWAQAHRLVNAALPLRDRSARRPARRAEGTGPDQVYLSLLCRVLRLSIRRAAAPLPFASWFSRPKAATPGGGPSQLTVDRALADAPAAVRAAYFLLVAEEQLPPALPNLLRECGIASAGPVAQAARQLSATLAGRHGVSLAEQQRVLASTAMNPKAAWLPAPAPIAIRAGRLARWGGLAGAAGLLAWTVAAATQPSPGEVPESVSLSAGSVSKVDPLAWQSSSRASIRSWPARGSLTGDEALILAAVRAWGLPTAQLLYAGDATGRPEVLLTDGFRLARYRDGAPVHVSDLSSDDIYGASVLSLGGGRYLTAPWVSQLESGSPLQPVPLADGLTGPLPAGQPGGCDSARVLRVTTAGVVPPESFTLGDLGAGQPAHLMYLPPVLTGPVQRPHEQDARGGPEAFAAAGCQLPALSREPLRSLTIWEFHASPLPGGQLARWLCARADLVDGGSAVSVLIAPGQPAQTQLISASSGNRLCSRLEQDVAAAFWWQAAGGWHYVAAGSRLVGQLSVTVDGKTKSGRGLVSAGPFPAPVAGATFTATRDGQPVPAVTAAS
jgi:hypothetical protein